MFNIWNSSIEGEWRPSLDFMGTHSSPVHSANKYLCFIGGYRFYQFTALPSSIATVFSRVHQGSKTVEADGSRRRHQDSPLYRQLANDNKFRTAIPGIDPLGMHLVEEPGLDHKFLKIRFISNSINRSYGYNSTSG